MADDEYMTTRPVYLTLNPPYLELRVEEGNEITLATNLEVEGEGEGIILVDSKQILPLLKENKMIELVFPKVPNQPLMIRNTDYWNLVMPIAMPKRKRSCLITKHIEQIFGVRYAFIFIFCSPTLPKKGGKKWPNFRLFWKRSASPRTLYVMLNLKMNSHLSFAAYIYKNSELRN